MNTSEILLDWLQLYRCDNVGPMNFKKLLAKFGSARAALDGLKDLSSSRSLGKVPKIINRSCVERELEAINKIGGQFICMSDAKFPKLLAKVEDGPPILATLGNIDLLEQSCVAMVGARNASINGAKFAQKLASSLAQAGYVVVSGLAKGIDGASHKGAIDNTSKRGTIAVLAGGVDHVYPKENSQLYHTIVQEGLIVSEMALGQVVKGHHFLRRNRIISGLSLGTIVVEASIGSGSLTTARHALEQNREVFAVPGPPYDPRARGCNKLLRDGAYLTESVFDVLCVLNEQQPMLQEQTITSSQVAQDNASAHTSYVGELEQICPRLLEAIGTAPTCIDDIVDLLKIEDSRLLGAGLSALELEGVIKRLPGNQIVRISQE